MKYDFPVKQSILHKNGYREKEQTGGLEYYKPIGKGDFPRFHIKIEKDQAFTIHIDKSKKHGSFINWVMGGGRNIINSSRDIINEAFILKLDAYDESIDVMKERCNRVLDDVKNKVLEIRSNIKR